MRAFSNPGVKALARQGWRFGGRHPAGVETERARFCPQRA